MLLTLCFVLLFVMQEDYYVAHQCFLTNRALYLLVWNVMDGEAGMESLTIWLQNLHVCLRSAMFVFIMLGRGRIYLLEGETLPEGAMPCTPLILASSLYFGLSMTAELI